MNSIVCQKVKKCFRFCSLLKRNRVTFFKPATIHLFLLKHYLCIGFTATLEFIRTLASLFILGKKMVPFLTNEDFFLFHLKLLQFCIAKVSQQNCRLHIVGHPCRAPLITQSKELTVDNRALFIIAAHIAQGKYSTQPIKHQAHVYIKCSPQPV